MSQHETFICIVLSEVSQIYSKFIIMIVMIIIMASVVMLFHYGISELERFESVTFIVLHHCPAVLTTFAGRAGASRGGAARVFHGASGRPSLPWIPRLQRKQQSHLCFSVTTIWLID